ncbi:MFS transporter [Nonomuraea typhae]|uniref:MFS transporter n=1 Tax=Nonomuraea typhae TaxID=2603600 RepID=A0ABW7Z8L5_9ACTN
MRHLSVESLTAVQVRRRFLLLYGLRWMPVGILIPSLVLLLVEREISIGAIGFALSLRGFVWLFLDIPAGGLADTWGRRPVLLTAAAITLASFVILATVETLAGLMIFSILQALYRALDSGTLHAWYVDATLALGAKDSLERGFRHAGSILGYGIAAGCLLSGLLVYTHPIPGVAALNQPVVAGALINVIALLCFWLLVPETKSATGYLPFLSAVRTVPATVRQGLRLVFTKRVLLMLTAVELLWGFGMAAYETLIPLRIEDVTSVADAAALLSPVTAAGWFVSSLGAAALPLLTRRLGQVGTAVLLRVVQGVVVVGMGLAAGPIGVIAGYLACYVLHGAAAPLHQTMLHDSIEGPHRTTASSVNSTANQLSNAIGLVVLTQVVEGFSAASAFLVAGVALAAAAPFYLSLRRVPAAGKPADRVTTAPPAD